MQTALARAAATAMVCAGIWGASATQEAQAGTIRVSIENLAPANGSILTPLWVGFHDGSFDTYNRGEVAAPFLERIAEDGNPEPISAAFDASGAGSAQGVLLGPGTPPIIRPGERASAVFDVDDASRFFSYASMVIPSNDAFVANGDPLEHELIGADGRVNNLNFFVTGADVLDAGTEVNDEIPANTAAFGQTVADTGVVEGGTVESHVGLLPASADGILADPAFAHADFTVAGYPLVNIRVSAVPIPGAVVLFVSALAGLGFVSRKRIATA